MTKEKSLQTTPTGNSSAIMANQPAPSPALVFDTINAYQKTAAIKAAIELDLFAAMAGAPATVEIIAGHCHAIISTVAGAPAIAANKSSSIAALIAAVFW